MALLDGADWNVAELARRMHMDQSTVNRLINGELRPGPKSIAGLIFAFAGPQEGDVIPDDFEVLEPPYPKMTFKHLFQIVITSRVVPLASEEEEAETPESEQVSA